MDTARSFIKGKFTLQGYLTRLCRAARKPPEAIACRERLPVPGGFRR
jgi:hypothetical protein